MHDESASLGDVRRHLLQDVGKGGLVTREYSVEELELFDLLVPEEVNDTSVLVADLLCHICHQCLDGDLKHLILGGGLEPEVSVRLFALKDGVHFEQVLVAIAVLVPFVSLTEQESAGNIKEDTLEESFVKGQIRDTFPAENARISHRLRALRLSSKIKENLYRVLDDVLVYGFVASILGDLL